MKNSWSRLRERERETERGVCLFVPHVCMYALPPHAPHAPPGAPAAAASLRMRTHNVSFINPSQERDLKTTDWSYFFSLKKKHRKWKIYIIYIYIFFILSCLRNKRARRGLSENPSWLISVEKKKQKSITPQGRFFFFFVLPPTPPNLAAVFAGQAD